MAWLFVPALAGWNSDSGSPWDGPIELSVTSSGTPTLRPSSWRGWKTRPWIRLLCGTISNPSMAEAGVDAWISSLLVSRASRGASPGSGEEPKTRVGSGRRSCELFATWSPESSSWKMSLDLFDMGYQSSSETWPASGSMRNGECLARQKSERRIKGGDFSSWPTATAMDSVSSRRTDGSGVTLMAAVRNYPTPRSGKHGIPGTGARHPGYWPTPNVPNGKKKQVGLDEIAKLWATPSARDWKSDDALQSPDHSPPLGRQVLRIGTVGKPTSERVALNPLFVEALMGFPREWTVCDASETLSSRNARRERFANWLRGWSL